MAPRTLPPLLPQVSMPPTSALTRLNLDSRSSSFMSAVYTPANREGVSVVKSRGAAGARAGARAVPAAAAQLLAAAGTGPRGPARWRGPGQCATSW